MENSGKPSKPTFSVIIIVAMVIASLFTSGLLGYLLNYYPNLGKIADLQNQLSTAQSELTTLQGQISSLRDSAGLDYQNITEAVVNLQGQLSA